MKFKYLASSAETTLPFLSKRGFWAVSIVRPRLSVVLPAGRYLSASEPFVETVIVLVPSTARAALAFLASAASWSLMRFSSATLASAFAFASDFSFASARAFASAFSFASARAFASDLAFASAASDLAFARAFSLASAASAFASARALLWNPQELWPREDLWHPQEL
jgi:hypothetical protein